MLSRLKNSVNVVLIKPWPFQQELTDARFYVHVMLGLSGLAFAVALLLSGNPHFIESGRPLRLALLLTYWMLELPPSRGG
jgi:hypothetical protein